MDIFNSYTLVGFCIVIFLITCKLTNSYFGFNFDLFKILKFSKEKKVVINEDHNVTFSV